MKKRCKIVYVLQRLVWVVYDVRLFQLQFLFLNQSVYYGNGGDVHNVAHGAIGIGEVYGFVQTHLYRTYDFGVRVNGFHHVVCAVSRIETLEYECVDIFSLEAVERIFLVAQFTVESIGNLHFAVNGKSGIVL